MSDLAHQRLIAELVPKGSRVLDLGCGDGSLLDLLQRERGCTGYGVEIADGNVLQCIRRGVDVIQLNLDEGLAMFDDATFDVVLQIDTLQHLRNAEVMLRRDCARGPLRHRRLPQLCALAQPPERGARAHAVTRRLPYQWYDAPNIRVGTYKDFEVLAGKNNLRVLDAFGLQNGRDVRWLPNARASTAVFKFERGG